MWASSGWVLVANPADTSGLKALGSLFNIQLHWLVLLEFPVTAAFDRAVMDEHVATPVVEGDEAVTLLRVEPLNFAAWHFLQPPFSGPSHLQPAGQLSPKPILGQADFTPFLAGARPTAAGQYLVPAGAGRASSSSMSFEVSSSSEAATFSSR
jgi:hypothetical protein